MNIESVNQYLKTKGLSWGEANGKRTKTQINEKMKKIKGYKMFKESYPEGKRENDLLDWLFNLGMEIDVLEPEKFLSEIGVEAEKWFAEGGILENANIFFADDEQDQIYAEIYGVRILRNEKIPSDWSEDFLNKHFTKYKLMAMFEPEKARNDLEQYLWKETAKKTAEIGDSEKLVDILKNAARLIHESNRKRE